MTSVGKYQLIAKDEEDKHFILNPKSSFFRPCFDQHTNFATNLERLNFQDVVKWGNKVSLPIPVLGDMLSKLTLEVKMPKLPDDTDWVHNVGYGMLDKVNLNIGGTTVFSVTGEYMHAVNQLQRSESQKSGLDFATGHMLSQSSDNIIYVPLGMHFTEKYSNALPLLSYSRFQETYLEIYLKPIEKLAASTEMINADLDRVLSPEMYVLAEYVLLDKWEKADKNSKEQEVMIEQVNFSEYTSNQKSFKIPLHVTCPLKEIIFMVQNSSDQDPASNINPFKYTYSSTNKNPIKSMHLNINGSRTLKLPGNYYNTIIPHQCHTNIPTNQGIMVYSFALYPEMYQPTGSINLNALGDAEMVVELEDDYYEHFPGLSSANIRMYFRTMNMLKVNPCEGAMLMYM